MVDGRPMRRRTAAARRTAGGLTALGALLALGACTSDDGGGSSATTDTADAPAVDVEITGPVTGGNEDSPPNGAPDDVLERYGYVEEEFLISGDATSYRPVGELTPDGLWTVREAETEPYTTRVLVRRPENPDDFSGTVVVEWFNVTGGIDFDPDFGFVYPVALEQGDAYVAVSTQKVSVDGAGAPALELPGAPPEELLKPLTKKDPERYGSLVHPGDDFSYDIATQVGEVARAGDFTDGAAVDNLILIGQSQSAGRLTTYINAVQPEVQVYDGFLVHSRGATGAPLSEDAVPPSGLAIRTDLDVPVFQFETETDLENYLVARQPNTDRIVTWEIAGTAHADASILEYGRQTTPTSYDLESLCGAVNTGPQAEALRAAFAGLSDWVVDGTEPPAAPRIESRGDTLVRDELGIVVGGVRTPEVDAPVATLSGFNAADNVICSLFGAVAPFTPEQLAALYPTHADYVDAVTESADAAVDAGWLLPVDGDAYIAEAEAASVPEGA